LKRWFTKTKKREYPWKRISCDDRIVAERIVELFEEKGVNASELEKILEAIDIRMPIKIREGNFPNFYVECFAEEDSAYQILLLPKNKKTIDIWIEQSNESRKYYVELIGEDSNSRRWQGVLEHKSTQTSDKSKNFRYSEKEFSYDVEIKGDPPKRLKISFEGNQGKIRWNEKQMEELEKALSEIGEDLTVCQIYQKLMILSQQSQNPLAQYSKNRVMRYLGGKIYSEIAIQNGQAQSYMVTEHGEDGDKCYQVFKDGSWNYVDPVTTIRYAKILNQPDQKYHTSFGIIGRENIDKVNPKEMVEAVEKKIRELMEEASMI